MCILVFKLDNPKSTNGFSKLAVKTAHFVQAHSIHTDLLSMRNKNIE